MRMTKGIRRREEQEIHRKSESPILLPHPPFAHPPRRVPHISGRLLPGDVGNHRPPHPLYLWDHLHAVL